MGGVDLVGCRGVGLFGNSDNWTSGGRKYMISDGAKISNTVNATTMQLIHGDDVAVHTSGGNRWLRIVLQDRPIKWPYRHLPHRDRVCVGDYRPWIPLRSRLL